MIRQKLYRDLYRGLYRAALGIGGCATVARGAVTTLYNSPRLMVRKELGTLPFFGRDATAQPFDSGRKWSVRIGVPNTNKQRFIHQAAKPDFWLSSAGRLGKINSHSIPASFSGQLGICFILLYLNPPTFPEPRST
ncbi:MAG TPA: hypothetical protein VHX12_11280 [Acidisoma sp.]|jgi:hypothetical protein|nr:hypothetical protein [Acidisoma sp.]